MINYFLPWINRKVNGLLSNVALAYSLTLSEVLKVTP